MADEHRLSDEPVPLDLIEKEHGHLTHADLSKPYAIHPTAC
jgi:hypothetical protein